MTLTVVLVAPPNPSMTDPRIGPPLGLVMLAGVIRGHGHLVQIIDLNVACYPPGPLGPIGHWTHDFSMARCMSEIPGGADVYGIGFASAQVPHARKIVEEIRAREPSALLVAGGPHPSAEPFECYERMAFDVVVKGEADGIIGPLLQRFEAVGMHRVQMRPYYGAYPILDGTHERPVDLDALPMPARGLLDLDRYTRRIGGKPATNMVSSRGCPHACAFCQQETLWGVRGLRRHGVDRVLAEVDDVRRLKPDLGGVLFLDDSLTARPRVEMEGIADGLHQRGVAWRGWTRAGLCTRRMDPVMLSYMARHGCTSLCIGLEAGTDRLLDRLDKGTTVVQVRQAIRNVHEAGMACRVSFMVGIPGETWDDIEALCSVMESERDHVDDWILSSFVPLPGSPAWVDPERYGLIIDKEAARRDGYRWCFVVAGDERAGWGYHGYMDGTTREEVEQRHRYVQERLLRTVPRHRVAVTVGGA